MANITVSDLRATGSELFMDSESFLDVLDNGELEGVNGGFTFLAIPIAIWGIEVTAGYVVGAMVAGGIVGGVVATRMK